MTLAIPQEISTALELLDNVGDTVNTIAINLGANRLDRRSFRKYLRDYADRASSDGRLINASREDTLQCANRGLLLAYAHMELICWLANNNYTISSTSVKWYSWRKIRAKYRLPLLGFSPQKSHLTKKLQYIKTTADQVYAEIDGRNVSISLYLSLGYNLTKREGPGLGRFGPISQSVSSSTGRSSTRCVHTISFCMKFTFLSILLVIGMDDVVHRATLAHKQLAQ